MEEAAANIRDAMDTWITDAIENGQAIPAPRTATRKRGPLEVEVPPSLESALTRGAVREGMDINVFVTTALAAAVGWRPVEGDPSGTWLAARAKRFSGPADPSAGRLLRFTAIGNAVLVALVAIVALVLIYVALKNA
jgi:hypothetical protein